MPPTLINSYSLAPIIGIGTHTPNENLTVVGNISATGIVYANSVSLLSGGFASFAFDTQFLRLSGGTLTGNLSGTTAVFNSVSATGLIQADSVTDTHGGTLIKKKSFTVVGDGTSQEFVLNHNFNTYDVLIQVYEHSTKETVICYSKNTDLNNTLIDVGTTLQAGVTGFLVVLFC